MKICFISTVFGDPTTIDRPALFKKMDGCDYFLFTDHDASYFGETSWDIVNIKSNKNISEIDSNIIKSRYPKFMSWELLESMGKTYDYVFYCDTWTWPNINMDWDAICKKVSQNKDFPLAQSMHPNPKAGPNPCWPFQPVVLFVLHACVGEFGTAVCFVLMSLDDMRVCPSPISSSV